MGKYKTFGSRFDRVHRNDLNANFADVEADINAQKTRVDDLIIGTPQPSEVVDSRGGFPVLGDRLADLSTSLAQNTNNLSSREINIMYPPAPLVSAKGDGVTDDTSVINGVIDYIKNSGGEIKIPRGTFRFTSKIIVPHGVTLKGSGMRESYSGNTNNRPTVLLKDGNFEGIEIQASSAITDMCIDGAIGNIGLGVRLNGNRARLENIIVSKIGGDGVVVGHSGIEGNRNSWILRNVASISNTGNGFVIDDYDPGYGPDANAGLAEKSNAWGNAGDGWVIGRCAVNTFLQCYGESNSGVGFRVKSTAMRNTFLSCGSEGNTIDQFLFESGSYNNLLFGANEFFPTDNGANTILNNTGGAVQRLNISKLINSGAPTALTTIGITSGFIGTGSVPGLILNDIDSPATEQVWDIIANAGNLSVRMSDDNGANPVTAVTFERVGKTLYNARYNSILSATNGIGVGNSAPATTLGTVVKKMQVFDSAGASLGYIPIYNSIT
jgi:hypothetical protein